MFNKLDNYFKNIKGLDLLFFKSFFLNLIFLFEKTENA